MQTYPLILFNLINRNISAQLVLQAYLKLMRNISNYDQCILTYYHHIQTLIIKKRKITNVIKTRCRRISPSSKYSSTVSP